MTQSPIGKGSRSGNFRKEGNRPYTELRTVNCITSTEIAENTGLEKEHKKTHKQENTSSGTRGKEKGRKGCGVTLKWRVNRV